MNKIHSENMPPLLRLLRPKQWIKTGFVFAPLFFSGKFTELTAWYLTLEAALCFLCVASAVYIVNDLHDLEEDRRHPVKKNRPVASGEIPPPQAALLAAAFTAATLYIFTVLPLGCALIILIYAGLNLLYTWQLKRIAIVDVFTIAFFYVLRVLMGCFAISVTVSPWIILSTFLLALFLGFGKRYHEMGFEEYVKYKANLQHYSRDLLDRLVVITGAGALMTYAIYAAELSAKTGHTGLVYTVGFVAFGLFRYLQAIHVYRQGGEPETVILRDKWQLINLVLWLVVTLGMLF